MEFGVAERPAATLPTGLAKEGYDPAAFTQIIEEARSHRLSPLTDVLAAVGRRLSRHAVLWRILAGAFTGSLLVFAVLHLLFDDLKFMAFVAVFVASLLSSIAGFAFSAICGAMLFPVLDQPVRVVQIMMVCSIAIQLLSVLSLKNAIDWRHLARFVAGGLAGLPVGIYLLMTIRPSAYMHVIGVFLIGYGLYMILRRPASIRIADSVIGDCVIGFCGGVTGGFAAFPGAFVTIWCGLKGWDKSRQRGVFQPYILIMQGLALAVITLLRASKARSTGVELLTATYLPAALMGTWSGIAIFRRLTDRHFAIYVNACLIISGIVLLL